MFILFHRTWYQDLMNNILIRLRNTFFWNTPLAFFPPQGFGLYFLHFILAEVSENEDFVALRCFALWEINFFPAKNGFDEHLWFSKKKCAQNGAKISLDMIQGTKRVLSNSSISKFHKIEPIYFLMGSW